MTERLFSFSNPNSDIMTVPREEGTDSDDRYFGSIGDATARHLYSLDDGERQMWQELIHMGSGAQFRMYPNPQDFDQDPMKLKGKKLDNYMDVYKAEMKKNFGVELTETQVIFMQEALDEEQARRERSGDVFEKNEIIPYHNWEQNPGMWKHIDIPSTPADRAAYMGNTRQNFYDQFPESHPDAGAINSCLTILNRVFPLDIDQGYCEFVEDWVDSAHMMQSTRNALKRLAARLTDWDCNADEEVEDCLNYIDQVWSIESKNTASRSASWDKMTKVMSHKKKEWEEQDKKGFNVYGSIKSFGRTLFENFRGDMKNYHWNWYRQAKKKYSPRVMLQNVDINRGTKAELTYVCYGNTQLADKLWFARPFETLEQAYAQGCLDRDCFTDNEATDAVLQFVDKHANIAKEQKDMRRMTDVSRVLLDMQRKKKGNLTDGQWSPIWRYYKIIKGVVANDIQKDEQ